MKRVLTISLLLFFFNFVFAQKKYVLTDLTKRTLPLQEIKIKNNSFLTSVQGLIKLDSLLINSLDNLYYQVTNDTIIINDIIKKPKVGFTKIDTKRVIRKIIKNTKQRSLKALAPFEYQSYNKFIVHSSKIKSGENIINKVLKKFNKNELKQGDEKRHIALSESISKRQYLGPLHQLETVEWSKISGVENPLFLSTSYRLQTIDITEKHLDLWGANYVNPFDKNAFGGYHYSFADTIVTQTDTLAKVYFNPKKFTRFEGLSGFAWINITNKLISSIYCEPTYGRKAKKHYCISFKDQKGTHFPFEVSSALIFKNVGSTSMKIKLMQYSLISNFNNTPTLVKGQFSDLAITYRKQIKDSIQRPIELNELEKNTYEYFKGSKKVKINRTLKFGEQLLFGNLRTKYANIHLPSILGYNLQEGIKTGLKISTNSSLSNKLKISPYFVYGWRDKGLKGGITAQLKVIKDDKLDLIGYIKSDFVESGAPNQTLTKSFSSSEFLRNFQLSIFDRQSGFGFSALSKPIKYLTAQVNIKAFDNTPQYIYRYNNRTDSRFRETSLDLKYAYGESFFRLYDYSISNQTIYPIVWLHLEKSILNSDYDYTRVQLRVRYTHRFILNGTTKVEFLAGRYWGELPYVKLFNGLGSARMKSLIKGAFETMEYNEFAADNYFIIFYTHDFGFFNFSKHKTFRPHVEIAVNYGLGFLKNAELHQSTFVIKSFNKGYGEIGASIKDLLLLYPAGIKIGLGVSFFHRAIGYRKSTFRENSILKLTTNFLF